MAGRHSADGALALLKFLVNQFVGYAGSEGMGWALERARKDGRQREHITDANLFKFWNHPAAAFEDN